MSGVFEARIFQNGIRMKTIGYTVNNKSFSEELKGITEISTSVMIPPKRLRKLINLLLEGEDFYNNKTIDLQPIKWFEVFYWPINTIKYVLTYFIVLTFWRFIMENTLAYFRVNPRDAQHIHRVINRENLLNFGTFHSFGMAIGVFYLSMSQEGLTALVNQFAEQGTKLMEVDAHEVRLQRRLVTYPSSMIPDLPDDARYSNGQFKV